MRFPGNCLVVALIASLRPGNRMYRCRNRTGRLHFFWVDRKGRAWEFYTKGASQRPYWRNALTIGEIQRTICGK